MDEEMQKYRNQLVEVEQKAQEDYDKATLTLSAGALGLSITFVKNILPASGVQSVSLLLFAWVSWTISVALVLASHYFGNLSLRKAISQVDKGTIRKQRAGGAYDFATAISNLLHGSLFVLGAAFMICFVLQNMGV